MLHDQLRLPVEPPNRRLAPRIRPMQPTDGARIFDDPAYLFEPWWPGTRLIVLIQGGQVRVQAAELVDPLSAFPELAALSGLVTADGVILDGVLMALDASGRPSPMLLKRRLADASSGAGRPALVATDLLRAGERPLAGQPFARRRERLAEVLRESDWCAVSRGIAGEGHTLAAAATDLGFDAISARRLNARYRQGPAGDAWLRLPIDEPSRERRMPPLLAVLRRLPL